MMELTELKICMMQLGAVFTPAARSKMCKGKCGHISFSDYATTGGVVIEIVNCFYVNVPVVYSNTPFSVDIYEDVLVIRYKSHILPFSIRIIPAPAYALDNICLEDGTPVREMVMTHADRMRISPIHGCSFHCQFCTCNVQKYLEISIDKLNLAVKIALNDINNKPRHVLISGGTLRENSETYKYINEVYKFFPNEYDKYEFDVMLSPRGFHCQTSDEKEYSDFIQYLHDECKISTLSVNLELYNEIYRKQFIPEKYEIGKENYFRFIKKAVSVFGHGKIRSSIIAGIETEEDTLLGVEAICEIGCIPVLSAFVPANGTFMERYLKPEVGVLYEIVQKSAEITKRYGTSLGPVCRPCTHNSLTSEHGYINL